MSGLVVENISKRFGAVEVLSGVSLAFQPGSVTALVGDNGAGKTTFLKILAGVYSPDAGAVSLNNSNLTNSSAESHRQAGIEMVYQDLALATNQDVLTNLYLGREITSRGGCLNRRQMRLGAQSILAQLGVTLPCLDLPVGKFSGGQQQAIAIARAVMFDPKVLLLDEPTAALAAKEVRNTLNLIRMQKEAGRIVVLVSHRLNDVMDVADRVVVFKHGKVFTDNSSSELSLADIVQRIVS